MLKEKIYYQDRLPLNIQIVDVDEYPIHFHDDLEIVFVLEGSIILKNGYYSYTMQAGDIFIFNDREVHSFTKNSDKNMVLMFQFEHEYFINHYPNLNNSFFVADMDDPEDKDLEMLRELLASSIMQANSGSLGYEQKLIEIAHNIIECLMENFQYFTMENGRFVNEIKNKSNKIMAARMNRVSNFLYENYCRKLTLKELADREHLSVYHLSHVIKQSTGLSFRELLGFIRVEESEKLILGTNMSISAISDEVGFSATRFYLEHFKKWFGEDPRSYREKNLWKVSSRKTPAKMRKVNKLETGEIVKNNYPDVYYDYHKKNRTPGQVIDINIQWEESGEIEATSLYKAMNASQRQDVKRPINMLSMLNEKVTAWGESFITTCDGKGDHVSILVYNLSDRLPINPETLVRVSGIFGKYDLKRVIFSGFPEDPDIVSKNIKHGNNERRTLFRQLESIPVVENSVVTAVNTLSFIISLTYMSGELLLLDRIKK